MKSDYEWLTMMGLCHKCRKEKTAPGKKYCFDCLEKIREVNARRYDPVKAKEYQQRRREIYQEKKAAGICVRCNKPATHGLYCYECRIKTKKNNTEKAIRRRLKRHERGLIPEIRKNSGQCIWCGAPVVPGLSCCEKHQKIFSDSGIKGYEANLINKNNHWINEVEAWKKKNNWKHSKSI